MADETPIPEFTIPISKLNHLVCLPETNLDFNGVSNQHRFNLFNFHILLYKKIEVAKRRSSGALLIYITRDLNFNLAWHALFCKIMGGPGKMKIILILILISCSILLHYSIRIYETAGHAHLGLRIFRKGYKYTIKMSLESAAALHYCIKWQL